MTVTTDATKAQRERRAIIAAMSDPEVKGALGRMAATRKSFENRLRDLERSNGQLVERITNLEARFDALINSEDRRET